MGKTAKLLIGVIIVAVIAGGAMLVWGKKDDKSPGTAPSPSTSSEGTAPDASSGGTAAEAAVTITYDGNGFSSSSNSMKAGQVVKVVNNSQKVLDFDSDPHPVHTDNTELNVGDIDPGQSKTFKINKTGMWGYHNHHNSSQHGEITVE